MGRNPYANSIIATNVVREFWHKMAGAEKKCLRTVQFKFSNGTMSRVFEKRKLYARDGDFQIGDIMGLNANDVKFVRDNIDIILESLDMTKDTLEMETRSEKNLGNGKVELDGQVYDEDKFY